MKFIRISSLLIAFVIISSWTAHKFYVSTTNLEYVPKTESIQVITKIFIDDMEDVLEERYDQKVSLNTTKETIKDKELLKRYILDRLMISVNGKPAELKYLGIDYDLDIVKSYIEIKGVKNLKSLEIENKILLDLFDDQKNIIHIKTPNNRRSLILEKDKTRQVLNFD